MYCFLEIRMKKQEEIGLQTVSMAECVQGPTLERLQKALQNLSY